MYNFDTHDNLSNLIHQEQPEFYQGPFSVICNLFIYRPQQPEGMKIYRIHLISLSSSEFPSHKAISKNQLFTLIKIFVACKHFVSQVKSFVHTNYFFHKYLYQRNALST